VSECCATPYSLLGLTSVVSYLALGLLSFTKFYLGGYTAVQNDNVMHSIILFVVITSTLQSMIEITDPIILALGASRNSCMLTSLQVTGTLMIYSLFIGELFCTDPIDSLDEIIYWFVVALCVVAYGTWESLYGEWSWMGASIIIIHSYFNVWLRAQTGWRSFLLRQEAAKKINSLPRATANQLQRHNDVCAICFQEMSSAVLTYCGHFFHGNCLRKWLYVQETCPMCHQAVGPTPPAPAPAPAPGHAAGDFQAAPPASRGTEPGRAAERRGSRDQPPANLPPPGSPDQQEGADSLGEGADSLGEGTDSLGEGADSLGEGADSLGEGADSLGEGTSGLDRGQTRTPTVFTSAPPGDFVGLVSPGSSCSSGGSPSPGNQSLEPWDGAHPTNRYNGGGVDCRIKGPLVQSTPREQNGRVLTRVNGATQELQD
ncbi:unnamed protein product, partial [Coregonus sp. 'balchen']